VPDYTTVYRFRHRLDEAALEQTLHAVVQRLASRLSRQVTVAVDATGLTPGAISPFCVKRANDRGAGFTWRHWLQWTMAVDIDHQVILAQTARRGPTHDCASWRPLVSAAHERVPIGVVLADAAFDRERNHQHSRQTLQAHSVIPAKRGAANWKIQGVRIRRHLRKGIDHTEVYTTITTTVVLAAVS
jgi:IS5 family transposase